MEPDTSAVLAVVQTFCDDEGPATVRNDLLSAPSETVLCIEFEPCCAHHPTPRMNHSLCLFGERKGNAFDLETILNVAVKRLIGSKAGVAHADEFSPTLK